MKKNILLLSVILLNSNIIINESKPTTDNVEIQRKVSKSKETASIKSGDILNIAEFTGTNSDMIFKIIKRGTGEKPLQGETLTVNYTGLLTENIIYKEKLKKNKTITVGKAFDSSLTRGVPFTFKLGARQVIQGWEMALADMRIGEERIVILPSKLAYGNRASSQIPADSPLIFYITLIKAS